MTLRDRPEGAIVVRRFTQNGCEVTEIVHDPADAQETLYGTVTRDGVLVGSFYCTDRVLQEGWHIVTADGKHVVLGIGELGASAHPAAVWILTTSVAAREV